MMTNSPVFKKKVIIFYCASFCAILLWALPLYRAMMSTMPYDAFSYIPAVPLFFIMMILQRKAYIFQTGGSGTAFGYVLVSIACVIGLILLFFSKSMNAQILLSYQIICFVLVITGIFILSFGVESFRRSLLAFVLLLFMVPIPQSVLDRMIGFLQQSSVTLSSLIFSIAGIPFFKDDVVFHFPSMRVVVAPECSGIHSSIAMGLVGIATVYTFLFSTSRRLIALSCIIPLIILKNAFRIVTLTLLGISVNSSFLDNSFIHRSAGRIIFATACCCFILMVWFLARSEKKGVLQKMS